VHVYLYSGQIMFVYEGHRNKVKVGWARNIPHAHLCFC